MFHDSFMKGQEQCPKISSMSLLLAAVRLSARVRKLPLAQPAVTSALQARHYTASGKQNPYPDPPNPKGKKKSKTPGTGAAVYGRVAAYGNKHKDHGKMCTGCGVEVLAPGSGGAQGAAVGGAAVLDAGSAEKRGSRYVDAFEKGSRGGGFLCARCKSLKKGDVWAAYDALRDVEPAVFKKQLKSIVGRRRFSLCVKVWRTVAPK